METKQKKKKPGRPEKSAAERHEWAAICNRIHEAAGGLTQAKVAEELEVDTRVWGSYLAGERSPKTLQDGAVIVARAEAMGWYSPKPADWMRQEQLDGRINPDMDITPADRIACRDEKEARQNAQKAALQAIKALRTLSTYPPEILAEALPERVKKADAGKLPPPSYAELHQLLENLWAKLAEEERFRFAVGG